MYGMRYGLRIQQRWCGVPDYGRNGVATDDVVWYSLEAASFIDYSSDNVLAPISGAVRRWNRESRSQFEDPITLMVADCKKIGMLL